MYKKHIRHVFYIYIYTYIYILIRSAIICHFYSFALFNKNGWFFSDDHKKLL